MISIKKIQVSPARVTITSDVSGKTLIVTGEDDIGALAESFDFCWSPEELREPLEAALDYLTQSLQEGAKVEDPGYFTAEEAGIKPYRA